MKSVGATLLEHCLVCERCRVVLERLLLEEGTVRHALEEGVLPPMRRQMELYRAHDLLNDVLHDKELRERLFPDPAFRCQVAMALDALCWALGHTHSSSDRRKTGVNFGALLLDLEGLLREGGYVLREIANKPPAKKLPEPVLLRKDEPLAFEFGDEESSDEAG